MPPFFTLVSIACSRTRTAHRNDRRQQPNPNTQATVTEHWTKLILSYARHRRLFFLRLEDAEVSGGDWEEVLRNERINRMSAGELLWSWDVYSTFTGRLQPTHLLHIMTDMVAKNLAVYEPVKQTRAVLLWWRTPDEWAEELHKWVRPIRHSRSSVPTQQSYHNYRRTLLGSSIPSSRTSKSPSPPSHPRFPIFR